MENLGPNPVEVNDQLLHKIEDGSSLREGTGQLGIDDQWGNDLHDVDPNDHDGGAAAKILIGVDTDNNLSNGYEEYHEYGTAYEKPGEHAMYENTDGDRFSIVRWKGHTYVQHIDDQGHQIGDREMIDTDLFFYYDGAEVPAIDYPGDAIDNQLTDPAANVLPLESKGHVYGYVVTDAHGDLYQYDAQGREIAYVENSDYEPDQTPSLEASTDSQLENETVDVTETDETNNTDMVVESTVEGTLGNVDSVIMPEGTNVETHHINGLTDAKAHSLGMDNSFTADVDHATTNHAESNITLESKLVENEVAKVDSTEEEYPSYLSGWAGAKKEREDVVDNYIKVNEQFEIGKEEIVKWMDIASKLKWGNGIDNQGVKNPLVIEGIPDDGLFEYDKGVAEANTRNALREEQTANQEISNNDSGAAAAVNLITGPGKNEGQESLNGYLENSSSSEKNGQDSLNDYFSTINK